MTKTFERGILLENDGFCQGPEVRNEDMAKKKSKAARWYVRTVKRYSLQINLFKWLELLKVLEDYAAQKDVAEGLLCHLGIDRNGNPGYRSGQDSRTSCTTLLDQGGEGIPPGGQSESETLSSEN